MASINNSIEIARSPQDVFAYLDQLDWRGEWQSQIVRGKQQPVTYEVTQHDPPRRMSFKGVNGPVRPVGTVTVEPAGEGRSKLTLELDLQGHGLLGKLIAPLTRSQSRKLVPQGQQRLKERLESGA